MSLSGIHDFGRLEAGFPIRSASGMTHLGACGRSALIRLICIYHDLNLLPKIAPGMSTPPVDNLAENPTPRAKKVKKIGGARILPNNYAKDN
jgi:hypothetical protein